MPIEMIVIPIFAAISLGMALWPSRNKTAVEPDPDEEDYWFHAIK